MIGDIWDVIKDLAKALWEIFWTLFTELCTVIWADFRPIVFALLAAALLWYLGGGYDNAEKYYQAQHNPAPAPLQIQNSAAPAADGGTVYIIK